MSEQAPKAPEFRAEHLLPEHEQTSRRPAEADVTPNTVGNDPAQLLAEARDSVAETAASAEQNPLQRLESEQAASVAPAATLVTRDLKKQALKRELKAVRRQLPAPARAFSRLVHQPVIRLASEAAGRTVARPSGLLGGGAMAFLGTALYLTFTKYYGIPYNYSVWLLLLAAGFVLGLVLELVLWPLTRRRD